MSEMLIIGIAGGTGSGKSTITERMKSIFGEDVTVLNHDNYYRKQVGKTYEERCQVNYDHPDSLETDLMAKHIQKLREGKSIHCPVYDFTVHNRTERTVEIHPTKVLIIDGILILADEALRNLMTVKIFVDTPDDIRILRRLKRDINQRARTLESVTSQYLTTVRPMHEQFVAPSKKFADIIIPEGGKNPIAMKMLEDYIRAFLQESK